MIVEIADLWTSNESARAGLIDVIAERSHLVAEAEGNVAFASWASIELPNHLVLIVTWVSLDAHEAFRSTEAFGAWVEALGPYLAGEPSVEHFVP